MGNQTEETRGKVKQIFANMTDYENSFIGNPNPESAGILYRPQARIHFLLLNLVNPMARRILDLGAGTGNLSRHGYEENDGIDIVSLDPSFSGLSIAREMISNLASPYIKSSYVSGDGHELPFAPESFDAVHAVQVIHWTDINKVLEQVYRILKPGGTFIFCTTGEFFHWREHQTKHGQVVDELNYVKHPLNRLLVKYLNEILQQHNLPTVNQYNAKMQTNFPIYPDGVDYQEMQEMASKVGFEPIEIEQQVLENIVFAATQKDQPNYLEVLSNPTKPGVFATLYEIPGWENVLVQGAPMKYFLDNPELNELELEQKLRFAKQAFDLAIDEFQNSAISDTPPTDASTVFLFQKPLQLSNQNDFQERNLILD